MGDAGKKELVPFVFDNDDGLSRDVQNALRNMGAADSEFLDSALAALNEKGSSKRRTALTFLKNFRDPPADKSKGVCQKLLLVVQERGGDGNSATEALGTWISKESAEDVARAVMAAERNVNCTVLITSLARFKDTPGVPEAIAKRIEAQHWGEPDLAIKLLEAMGPAVATKALLTQMNHQSGLRDRVRLLLSKYGVSQEAMVEQTIKDLGSPVADVRRVAVQFMVKVGVPTPKLRDAAAKALNPLIYDEQPWHRDQAFEALAIWWNKDTAILLCKTVTDATNRDLRHRSMDVLAKTADPALAAHVAARLPFNEDRGHAAARLRQMGRVAETAVAPYVLDKDRDVRNDALRIIEEIGSRASVPTLEKAFVAYGGMDAGFAAALNRVGKLISMR
jgi:hypothetical protein